MLEDWYATQSARELFLLITAFLFVFGAYVAFFTTVIYMLLKRTIEKRIKTEKANV